MLFIQEDFYIPMLETLTNQNSQGKTVAQLQRFTQALSLLDAHVYQKVNDYNMQSKSLLTFVRDAFKNIEMRKLTQIVLKIFY